MTGAGKQYEHENNYIVNQPTAKVATGWFSYEFGSALANDFRIDPIMSTRHNASFGHVDPQEEYFRDFKKSLSLGGAPQKTLASTMPHFKARVDFKNVISNAPLKHLKDIEEKQGHLVADPSLYRRIGGTRVIARDEIGRAGVRKTDHHRHKLACHGIRKHDRKEVPSMAKCAKTQKWMADYQKGPKTRREKGPLSQEVAMKDYFRTKMPDSDVLLNPNPEVVTCETTRENLRILDKFILQKTLELGPCMYDEKKRQYVPME